MDTAQFSFTRDAGWSAPLPALDSPATLVLAFGDRRLLDDPEPLSALAAAYPRSVIAGCSSAGQLVNGEVSDRLLDVTVTRFEDVELRVAAARVTPGSSHTAGLGLGATLAGVDAALVFCDGMQGNGTQLARGLAEALPNVPIGGALAADGSRFERTWVCHEGILWEGLAVAVGLCGPGLDVRCASGGGWVGFGSERIVTGAEGSVVLELAGEPALDVYRRYLGEHADDLPASGLLFPLTIRRDRDDPEPMVRTIIAVDEQARSLTFAGDVPEGSRARLMTGSPDRLLDGAYEAATSIGEACDGRPSLVVAVSCVGRRLVYGPRVHEEAEIAMAELAASARQCGLFSYGELGPSRDGGCVLYNQTFTSIAFTERSR